MDVNFEWYKIFYYAAQSENFSEAARQLYITQSAVSQGIKNLENKLGVTLFDRNSRRARLTPEGKLLFSHISQAFNYIKTGEKKLAELHQLGTGEIRVGASDTVCKYYLIPYLREFNRRFPNIKIQVINRTSPQIVELLEKGSLDCGIITMPVRHPAIETITLAEVEDIWVASDKFKHLSDRTLSLPELIQEPLLLLEKTSATRQNLDRFFQKEGLMVTPEIELESVDLLLEFAKIGLGIAHMVRESAVPFIARGELFEISCHPPLPPRQLGMACVKNVPLSRAAEQFIETLLDPGRTTR